PHEPLMREEIFGPVLPILSYRRLDEAIAFINARPKPLAAYVFTRSAVVRQQAISAISAGAVVVNHVGTHVLVHALPFGGVGASGTGAYHGRWGFETMSHRKAVLERPFHPDPRAMYPPYRGWKRRALRWLF
ncbi:MAG TPA: aldehyde dehydrogenase family protein, partial [Gemmatimonadales bacterium]|nr:aldehyde dehydrogenase family protein [Gemmatimonadales bacterium]